MIRSIEFIRDLGNNQPLVVKDIKLGAPETSGLWVKSIKGIGPGKATINTTDIASSDGGIFNSARSEIRNITVTLGLIDYVDSEKVFHSVEDVRRDLYKIFGKKREIIVRIHTDYGMDKDNKNEFILYTSGYVESCEPDIFNKRETVAISIICPDPNFYKVDGYNTIDFSATENLFEFPINQELSEDDPFIVGQFYYEYDSENDEYFISGDVTEDGLNQERKDGKSYYTGGLMNNTEEGETEYVLTSDESFIIGKEYFREDPLNPGQMISAPELEMISGTTYYEYNNKIEFAEIIDVSRKIVSYYGEIEVGVTINIKINDDSVSGLAIYRILEYSNEEISIDDTLLPDGALFAGDEITICTIKGKKSAQLLREGQYSNIMNALGRNPSWFELDFGDNAFTYIATTGAEFVDISISYEDAYEGI